MGLWAVLIWGLSSCSVSPVDAEDRLFVPLSVEVLDEFVLPFDTTFEGTKVGGLSAIAYDRAGDRFFALPDDRSNLAPARFYELKIKVNQNSKKNAGGSGANLTGANVTNDAINTDSSDGNSAVLPQKFGAEISSVNIERLVTLKDENDQPFESGTIDPEGFVLTPRGTAIISSEGDSSKGIDPFISEFDLETGQQISQLPMPTRYLPKSDPENPGEIVEGVRNNFGFESLTTEAQGRSLSSVEPFRIFTAVESALAQDVDDDLPTNQRYKKVRWLHYSLGTGRPFLISEHLYELDDNPDGAIVQGLTEILALDTGGRFLSLERSFGEETGFGVKLYEVALGAATDTAAYDTLRGDLEGTVAPARKRLLLDLRETDLDLDNLEGMAIGPRLPDGDYSLILVSDNNFQAIQKNQFLLLRLDGYKLG
ncbi:MAG: esterase-like activity of phytase family protein [Cyanobacteria bacterium P01_D01_bin.73]